MWFDIDFGQLPFLVDFFCPIDHCWEMNEIFEEKEIMFEHESTTHEFERIPFACVDSYSL